MAGVTPDGYELKTLNEINAEATVDLNKIVDPVTGENFVSNLENPSDIISQIVAITNEGVADGLLVDQAAYTQFDPSKATGDAQSSLAVLNGIRRLGATSSVVDFTLTGTPLATIPLSEGIEVTDSIADNIWRIIEDIVFDVSGDASGLQAVCQTLGAIEAAPNTLTQLVLSNADIFTVTNPSPALVGSNVETDAELRQRRDRSTTAPSIGIPSSIFAAISNLEGVTSVRVYNNVTLVTDINNVPPKTLTAVVVGGDDTDIAEILFSRNGCADYAGNVVVNFIDIQGFPYAIKFFRPVSITIFTIVNISITEDDIFPADGVESIKQAIVEYAVNGAQALGITEGFDTNGFTPGADVLVSRLFTPINSVPGHTIDSVLIGFSPAPTLSDDLVINFNEVSDFQTANIIVNAG